MKKVNILGQETNYKFYEEQTLLDGLLENGYFVDNPCNGKGTCGKCKVRIVSGDLNEMSTSEKSKLSDEEILDGIRLSCYIDDWTEMEVEIIQEERKAKVLTEGYMPNFEREYKEGFGVSIDIGTTTVTLSLINLRNGKALAEESMINMQKNYGLDVLTRISYSDDNEDGLERLKNAIIGSINAMLEMVCKEAKVGREEISDIVVACNTTMAHLFLGKNPSSLGKFPYKPVFTEMMIVSAKDIGIEACDETKVYTLPNVSAFIGSDVVAGAYVCEMGNSDKNELFIDIGTNGEIILSKGRELFACSCALGPALEGMNISCGMRAQRGAIEDVKITEDKVELKVIDDETPMGICGSGILAVVKELLESEIINSRGAFIKREELIDDDYRLEMIKFEGKKRAFILDKENNLYITQNDIRQVQLAKGAILSGFVALLKEAGINMKDLDVVYVAGQFGAHLPKESLIGIGILPQGVKDKIKYLGNSSKTGAYMALMSDKIKEDMDLLAKKIKYIELAVIDNYERIFLESSIFPKYLEGKIVEKI